VLFSACTLYPQAVPNAYAIEKRGIAPCRDACPAGQRGAHDVIPDLPDLPSLFDGAEFACARHFGQARGARQPRDHLHACQHPFYPIESLDQSE